MRDLLIIGAGPAGYVAAGRAGAMGKTVLLVEREALGGACLNKGCIPTKSFLNAAKLYDHALHSEAFGVTVEGAKFDYPVMRARTAKVQSTLVGGIAAMMKRNKVEVVAGDAVIVDKNTVAVGGEKYEAANILIATGSRPAVPPVPGLEGNPAVVDSTGILAAERLAESVVVIGGGVIGIEFACFFALLGKQVTVVEMLPQICGTIDNDIAVTIQRRLEGKGAKIHTGAKVDKVEGAAVFFTDKTGAARTAAGEVILCATGRVANTDCIGIENIHPEMGKRNIIVDGQARTSVPGVYAAGDVTGRRQLAHFASRQAEVAVNTMFGVADECRERAIPAVIYTDPEVAVVGLSETEAKARGVFSRSLKMPLGASGRFLAEMEGVRGFMKAVLGEDGLLLGMQIVGPYASEMAGAACVMIEKNMRAKEIREIVFPHPTVAEIMKEIMSAAL